MSVAKRLIGFPLCVLIATTPAMAQGRSTSAPGKTKAKDSPAAQSGIAAPSTTSAATSTPASSASSAIYYGSWLDDASIVPSGGAWLGLSTGYWKADAMSQIDAPVMSAVVGLNRRMQIGGSVPIYHFRDGSGVSESGIGNMAIYGKAMIVDAAKNSHGVGLAVAPLLEISTSATDRFGWALPLNIEVRRDRVRLYGSGGYFSRGAVFASVAAEVPLGNRTSVTGNFGQSYAVAGSHQTSIGASGSLTVTPTASLYVGLGRTFQPASVGVGGTSMAGGVSFLLSPFSPVRKP